jgi:hypothetical protein
MMGLLVSVEEKGLEWMKANDYDRTHESAHTITHWVKRFTDCLHANIIDLYHTTTQCSSSKPGMTNGKGYCISPLLAKQQLQQKTDKCFKSKCVLPLTA